MLLNLIVLELCAMAAMLGIERLWGSVPRGGSRWLNMQIWAVYMVAAFVAQPLLAALAIGATNRFGVFLVDLATVPFIWGFIAFALAMDLAEYAFHRAQHRIPVLWRMHSLHHSDRHMDATTTLRHFWADPILKGLTVYPLVGLVLKPTPDMILVYALLGLLNLLFHSSLPIGWGRFSFLLNSPAYHRVHHSVDQADYNINFAALFPIFDVIFRTYRQPMHSPQTGLDIAPDTIVAATLWPLRARKFASDAGLRETA